MNINNIFDFLGSYMVIISTLLITYLLYNKRHCVACGISLQKYGYMFIIGGIINLFLKNITKQSRPNDLSHLGIGYYYGMPSGHAQFSTFNIVILLYILCSIELKKLYKYLFIIAGGLIMIITGYHRVYFGYHTINQVLVGTVVGFSLALLSILDI